MRGLRGAIQGQKFDQSASIPLGRGFGTLAAAGNNAGLLCCLFNLLPDCGQDCAFVSKKGQEYHGHCLWLQSPDLLRCHSWGPGLLWGRCDPGK